MEIRYLLVSEKFMFLSVGRGKYALFLRQKVDRKMIFTGYRKDLVLNFSVMGNTVFFQPKVDLKIIFTWFFQLSMIFQDLANTVPRAVITLIKLKTISSPKYNLKGLLLFLSSALIHNHNCNQHAFGIWQHKTFPDFSFNYLLELKYYRNHKW